MNGRHRFQVAELQSTWIARVFAGELPTPSTADMTVHARRMPATASHEKLGEYHRLQYLALARRGRGGELGLSRDTYYVTLAFTHVHVRRPLGTANLRVFPINVDANDYTRVTSTTLRRAAPVARAISLPRAGHGALASFTRGMFRQVHLARRGVVGPNV